ncbi:FadR/GntR family transcriptional regulator [Catenuloplanes nepalensis]|uniref:FadR/GntR family transcriptional regulator n=1 Tax=Catenuloplanes nepalensis TaxID=587533 RepID=UPI0027D890DB|nr:winged helix-turn-helix domain-containing protein [Catenuloplanes nepalensis]
MSRPAVVVGEIRARIADGRLQPGDRLPTGRELAAGLRVGAGAVREAVTELVSSGEIVCRQGLGRWVATRPPGPRCMCGCSRCCSPEDEYSWRR